MHFHQILVDSITYLYNIHTRNTYKVCKQIKNTQTTRTLSYILCMRECGTDIMVYFIPNLLTLYFALFCIIFVRANLLNFCPLNGIKHKFNFAGRTTYINTTYLITQTFEKYVATLSIMQHQTKSVIINSNNNKPQL